MTDLTRAEEAVLANVAAGRSAWHGWEAASIAMLDGDDAYRARRNAIENCRKAELLTDENVLTARARAVLARMGARRG